MTVKEFYESINESYDHILTIFRDDQKIVKFLKIFNQDETVENLNKFLNERNYAEAFRMAHTLKGMALNMGFNKLNLVASNLTELLRPQIYNQYIETSFNELKVVYTPLKEALIELLKDK